MEEEKLYKDDEKVKLSDVSDASSSESSLSSDQNETDKDDEEEHLTKEPRKRKSDSGQEPEYDKLTKIPILIIENNQQVNSQEIHEILKKIR